MKSFATKSLYDKMAAYEAVQSLIDKGKKKLLLSLRLIM
jgi:hypothetical protein